MSAGPIRGIVLKPGGVTYFVTRFPVLGTRLIPLAILSLLAVAGDAQTRRPRKPAATTPPAASAERTSWPLETLKVEGNQNYTAAQILAVAQLRVGQTAGKPEFEAARERLEACGAFDRVGYRFAPAKDGQGFDAILEVTEMAQMYPLRCEDLPATDAQLRAWLKQQDPLFAPKTPATKLALERYTKLVSEFLAQKNYHEPVIAKIVSEGLSDLVILFRPAKPRPSVARIKFNNTGEIPAVTLQTAMYSVAIGVGYTEPQIRLLLDSTIRPLYEAKGMIRVAFPKIETEPVKDVEGVMVTIQVEPGPVYKLGKIRFAGVDMSPDELAERANLKGGKTVNFDEVKAADERVTHSLKREGYVQAKSEVKRAINDADKTVDVTFQIAPGPLFTFGNLTIVGLDIETEPVVRKLWGLLPAKPFNIDYPNHFLERIKEQELFENLKKTRAENKIDAAANTIDVTLYFNK